ncbi:hypothetical protein TspCOW1_19880 [Thiohalobacter sp. COW1]|uniref:EAL domain-containing protein n=1 Tax=Thiohalobacter sp. COW1 TaxID=2795687 RepID=UPI001914E7FB|nr:EAL domain-containing protein [Thiohalobacter sp. COW1]BCO31885.1 hypothetical protein TspCOW1_19880 [Thiohalobacter sp. COW1]
MPPDRSASGRYLLFALLSLALPAGLYLLQSYPPALLADPGRQVRVGVYDNAPKIHQRDDGSAAGLFVELIREIARREQWQLEFVACEWQDCLRRLERGDLDLMPDVAFTETRDRRFAFHRVPVTHSWSVVLTRDDAALQDLPDLDGKRIALLAGAVQTGPLETMMQAAGLNYSRLAFPSYAQAFAAVRDGAADAVVSNSYYANAFAPRYDLRQTPVVFNPAALFYAASPGDPLQLLPAIDAHLEAWRYDEGSVYYRALQSAMVPAQEPVVPPLLRLLLLGGLGLLLAFLALSALLRWQVKRRTAELRRTNQRLDHMLDSSPVVLYQLTLDQGRVNTGWVSHNIQRLFGFGPDEFVGRDLWRHQLHPEDREAVLARLRDLPEKQHLVQEYRILDARGRVRFVRDEMQLQTTAGPSEIVGSWNDLTESHEQAERLTFLTHYDPLTGLPNRSLLRERLTHAIHRARREDCSLALLHLDIDRFKLVNESFGQRLGDSVLNSVATRLAAMHDGTGSLARTGGNGFVLLLEDIGGRQGAAAQARQILKRFAEPIEVGGQELALTLSTGIALFPDDGTDADSLLQHAEAALFEAKQSGRNSYRFYTSAMSVGVAERVGLESALRGAVARGELLLHYQPQIDLQTRALVGVEALVRWRHPKLGLVPPGRFIPVAEEMGIIGEIGVWVLEEACRQLTVWDRQGLSVPRVAVNLSVQQIDSESLLPLVRRILDQSGLAPGRLELEITESILMHEPEQAAAALHGFRELGIQIAIDDFGTGYSSLHYLKHLPIDRLKIDQSFVRDIGTDTSSEAISRAVIGLARSLELETVAEGIEDETQLVFLCREGCSIGQGYLFSRPLPADALIRDWRPSAQVTPGGS